MAQSVVLPEVADDDPLSRIFAALADPTRRAILVRLRSGPASVAELGAPFAISGPAVSKHLRVLEGAGLVSRARIAQSRPASLQPDPFRRVAAWTEEFRDFWDARYDRLDDYLSTLSDPPRSDPPRSDAEPTPEPSPETEYDR